MPKAGTGNAERLTKDTTDSVTRSLRIVGYTLLSPCLEPLETEPLRARGEVSASLRARQWRRCHRRRGT